MVSIEKRGKPTVGLVNKGFMHDFMSAASGKGLPAIRFIAESIPSECVVEEQIEAGINAELENIIAALTRPLTPEEKNPKAKELEQLQRIVFKGTMKDVNRFFYKRGWADGFPVVPPTEEEVTEMLTGTDLPPDHVIAKLMPRLGKATVEKIAINAVMAGALPTYMPILITAVQALVEYGYFRGQAVSAGSWSPCYLFNGPIRDAININTGVGVMSPGNIANAAIGRAMGLIVKNIGGIRKGIEDMGNMGNPGKYTLVLGENEEQSPWEPLHVQHGFNKEDSVVTIFMPNTLNASVAYGTSDEMIVRTIAYNISPSKRGTIGIFIGPVHARVLAEKGWRKEDVINFIAQYARAPLSHTPAYWRAWLSIPREDVQGMAGQKGLLLNPKDSPNESVPIVTPELIRLFVTGGTGGDVVWLAGVGRWKSKKIELPANWNSLVKKYKDIVPNYALY
jgi:hypothetical protein